MNKKFEIITFESQRINNIKIEGMQKVYDKFCESRHAGGVEGFEDWKQREKMQIDWSPYYGQ